MVQRIKIILISLAMLACANVAVADILVSPSIVNFFPNELPRKDIVIINQGNHSAYIDATPYIVKNPGTKSERKVLMRDPAKAGLLVSPSKFIIPPKQHRVLRIMQLSPNVTRDKIYRISVASVPKKLLHTDSRYIKRHRAGIRIVVAYGVLTVVRPQNAHPDLVVTRSGKNLTIKNKGNTNIAITSGKQCHGKDCFELLSHRMYAGNVWHQKLKFAEPITIYTDYLGKKGQIKSN